MFKYIKHIGPGAIVASATIGAGETVLAVRVGAWGGYDLLWLILLAAITKSFLTLYLLGRYAAMSGEVVADRLVNFPGPRGWVLWTILVLEALVAPLVFVVIAVPCGQLMSQVLATVGVAISYKWLALLFVSLAIGFGAVQRYGTLEKSQMIVCSILFVGTVTATLLVGPNLVEIAKGLFGFGHFPAYPDWLPSEISNRSQFLEMASVFGYAGSIPMNYVVYSNWVLIKGWTVTRSSNARTDFHRGLGPLRWDVGFNAILVLVVTAAFMIAGAAILRPLHRIPDGFNLLTEQTHIFSQISVLMVPLYYAMILTALWGTLNALPDIYVRGGHSFLCRLLSRDLEYSKFMKVFAVTMMGLTWLFIWTETTPIFMIDIVALFSTNIGVGIVCIAALWLDHQLPPERRASLWIWWATVASALVINFMSLVSAREVIGKYLG
ncbi:MAG: Nramp family divalent metal transporter [Acidobacteriota bacterium]|nr:Nramp family divalent metal transporter [Acidobacteriota bacterium]